MTPGPGTLAAARASTSAAGRRGDPVVVLTYAHAGADRLRSVLAGCPELACTSGTGVLPLCEQAALTWRQAEGRDGPPSALAVGCIRALADSVITTIVAREGKPRWCEIMTAPPACAETFLRVYPGTRFLCLHRSCAGVIRSAQQANPWGPAGPEFRPFAAAYPGCSAAALAAYWAARTEPLLQFEAAHPDACRQVRYEDVARDQDREVSGILPFLGLGRSGQGQARWLDDNPGDEADAHPAGPPIPAWQITPPLRSQVNDLLARLRYPSLSEAQP